MLGLSLNPHTSFGILRHTSNTQEEKQTKLHDLRPNLMELMQIKQDQLCSFIRNTFTLQKLEYAIPARSDIGNTDDMMAMLCAYRRYNITSGSWNDANDIPSISSSSRLSATHKQTWTKLKIKLSYQKSLSYGFTTIRIKSDEDVILTHPARRSVDELTA